MSNLRIDMKPGESIRIGGQDRAPVDRGRPRRADHPRAGAKPGADRCDGNYQQDIIACRYYLVAFLDQITENRNNVFPQE
jgi:hypothetical protein